jgi:hypothetical protein
MFVYPDLYPFRYMVPSRVGLFYPWILVAALGEGHLRKLAYFSPDFVRQHHVL